MNTQAASLLVDCRAVLGEGLTWHAATRAWIWTDIESATLWRHLPASGLTQSCALPDRVGAFVPARSGQFLLGFAKRLAWAGIDWVEGRATIDPIIDVEPDQSSTRVNDGRTDRDGNFVFGTMNEASGHAAIGHLYQYSSRHGLRRLEVGTVGIANSICFSPAGTTLYFCDSTRRQIMSCAYDAARATVGIATPLVTLEASHGMPDGSVVDAGGAIWNAQWGGAAVRQYSPGGQLLTTLALPVDHVTCPAFGGPDLDVLCVTTARMGVAEHRLEAQPETGGVYRLEAHGATGIAEREFDDD